MIDIAFVQKLKSDLVAQQLKLTADYQATQGAMQVLEVQLKHLEAEAAAKLAEVKEKL
jgi:hypothetical protein